MKTGQNHAPKVYELVELQTEKPAIKADMGISFIHLYATHAVCSDGEKMISVPLTAEQIVQMAADSTELAAKILRWEVEHVRGKADTAAADRGVPGAGR